ncbi:MAG: DNA replication/repair protein RecF [Gammaproteobacteria bacterium]|nr:MAG: DNA replication/repair protein RecF [Gammaproteobacteria bacterium]
MTLKRLAIQNLRNLNSVDIQPSRRVNLFYGENGSGKTSVLEAISVLALGRSFRSHKHKPLITHGQHSFTVFGKILADDAAEIPIGINRQLDGSLTLKVSGNVVGSAAALAFYLPVQVINSDSFLLLEGSPKIRRQFLDWLVFHVEHQFFQTWKDCQRCLKHRNTLLRHDRMTLFELSTWDRELSHLTEEIHVFRTKCFDLFKVVFYDLLKEFINIDGIAISYYRGWDKEKIYSDVLIANFDRDRQSGYTQSGSHRADLRITIKGQNAAEILSRGQQKLLVCALKIAQGYVFSQMTGRKTLFLIDDLPAELDENHRKLLSHWLNSMETQVFITGVELEMLRSTWEQIPNNDLKMFHVEHGSVKEINFS